MPDSKELVNWGNLQEFAEESKKYSDKKASESTAASQAEINKVNAKAEKAQSDIDSYKTESNTKFALKTELAATNENVSQNASDIQTANERINQIIALPEGSTVSEARLEDICVKEDGTKAASPGAAVREQIAEVKGEITKTNNEVTDLKRDLAENTDKLFEEIDVLKEEIVFSSYGDEHFEKTSNYYVNGNGVITQAPLTVQGYFYSTINVENGDEIIISVPSFYTSVHGILSLWKDGVCKKVLQQGATSEKHIYINEDGVLYFSGNTNYPISFTLIKRHNSQLEKIKNATTIFAERHLDNYENSTLADKAINVNGAILDTSSTLGYFYVPIVLNKNDIISVKVDGMASSISVLSIWKDDVFVENLLKGKADMSTIEYKYIVKDDNTEIRFCARRTQIHELNVFICDNKQYKPLNHVVMKDVKQEYGHLNQFKFEYAVNKVLCIGDSLTAGAYYGDWFTETHNIGDDIKENYPKVLGRMLNCDVVNGGVNGDYPTRWVVNELPKYNLYDYDTFIIWLGTNNGLTDTLDTDVTPYSDFNQYANTETGKYCYLIEKIRSENPSAFIMVNTVFFSSGNKDTTNIVIKKIAEKYGLKVNDLSMYDHSNYPEYHANQGNIHLGKAGNIVIANTIKNNVHKWFAENPLLCEFHVTNTVES